MIRLLVCVCLAHLAHLAEAQMLRFGTCSDFTPYKHFDVKRYLGRWYQQERFFSWLGMVGSCWVHDYSPDPEAEGQIKLELTFTTNGKETSTGLNIYQQDHTDPATFTSTYHNLPFTADEYKVLATDYVSWAVEYRCKDRGLLHRRESLWLLTRETHPPQSVLDKAHGFLNTHGIKMKSLGKVDQSCYSGKYASKAEATESKKDAAHGDAAKQEKWTQFKNEIHKIKKEEAKQRPMEMTPRPQQYVHGPPQHNMTVENALLISLLAAFT